jgi:hypothetical protein
MVGQFLPPDHSKGDANTLGGYVAVHDRPAAFEGSDGFSYSVEIVTDETGEPAAAFGAYFLFVKWARIGAAAPLGHLETDFVARADSERAAHDAAGTTALAEVKRMLDALIAGGNGGPPTRRWWDAMRDDDTGTP